jgi:hypothetical protein
LCGYLAHCLFAYTPVNDDNGTVTATLNNAAIVNGRTDEELSKVFHGNLPLLMMD